MTKLGTKWVRNDQTGYEMTKLKLKVGTKWPKWYEITWVRNDLGTKWPVTILYTLWHIWPIKQMIIWITLCDYCYSSRWYVCLKHSYSRISQIIVNLAMSTGVLTVFKDQQYKRNKRTYFSHWIYTIYIYPVSTACARTDVGWLHKMWRVHAYHLVNRADLKWQCVTFGYGSTFIPASWHVKK